MPLQAPVIHAVAQWRSGAVAQWRSGAVAQLKFAYFIPVIG